MMHPSAALLTIAALLCTAAPPPFTGAGPDKLDAPVREALAAGGRIPVLVLCRDQLLLGPGAFEAFAREHADRARRELRAEVVAELRALANRQQPAVLAAIGDGAPVRRFWIVNAVEASLTPDEIERVAALDEVRFVYHAGTFTSAAPAGGVATVLPEAARRPFAARGKRVAWDLKKLGADKVWKQLGVTGEGVVVALLDAGTEYTHPDLRRNVWRNAGEVPNNGRDDDANGYADDLYGYDFAHMRPEVGAPANQAHGTWTAGIVVGDGAGGTVTGVAPRARLMLLRFGPLDAMMLAHEYAIENGADVMNMSFSIPDLGNVRGVWRLMSDHAVAAGLVLVSGVGNFQQTEEVPEQIRIPEGIPSVVGVGGVDRRLALAPFSSIGPVEWASVVFYGDYPLPAGLTKPDVVAFPGPGYPLLQPWGGYIDPNPNIAGNSFSSPHVSGVAALMLAAAPDLPAWRVREILEATAADLDAPGKDVRTGAGLVDALRAVRAARDAASVTGRGF
jgi:subtilisin family serine protease